MAGIAASADGALAGAIAEALTPSLGPDAAHDAAAQAIRDARETGRPVSAVLAGHPGVDVALLDRARTYDVGAAGIQVDTALQEHRRLIEGTP
jgi:nucleotide-binding universal stress UspA family protein